MKEYTFHPKINDTYKAEAGIESLITDAQSYH